MPKTLLIIGAGLEQVPAYLLAKSRGLRVVGTDMDPNAPGFEHADYRLIASTRDVDETCAVVDMFAKTIPIDGVMTIANDVPYTVARVAEMLALPGASPAAVRKLTNKIEMKSAFHEAGVSTPAFFSVQSKEELGRASGRFGYPFILKPSDGRGSKGVLLIDDNTDTDWAFDHAMSYCSNGVLVAEEYVPGAQLSVEGMFLNGQYRAVAFADRNYENLPETKPFIVEDGGTIPSAIDKKTQEDIQKTIERGALAVGLDWGTVKADIVLEADGTPSIIELAGRLSGNYLATHHIPFAYGVDLVGCVIDSCLGVDVDVERLRPSRNRYLGVRYFFPPCGTIASISGENEARELPYVYELLVYPKVGDIQPEISHHGARAGTVMTEGSTYEEATRRAQDVVAMVHFEIEPHGKDDLKSG